MRSKKISLLESSFKFKFFSNLSENKIEFLYYIFNKFPLIKNEIDFYFIFFSKKIEQ